MLNERETNMFAFTKKSLSLFAKKILKEFKIFICKLKLFKKKINKTHFVLFIFFFFLTIIALTLMPKNKLCI